MRFETLNDWLTWLESFHPKEIDLGLERVKKVYSSLNPENTKCFTISIAGTNGKGSCVAMLDAIFRHQGYRVGAYTSPHLLRYNERIRIDGKAIDDHVICEAFEKVDQARDVTSLSYFEFGTLAALDIFARGRLDIQLLEVGLGGRLDAVNIVDADLTLVTGIEIDHSDWLGESREAIGREKAGIFRQAVPAVIGDPNPPNSLLELADRNNVPLFRLGKQFNYRRSGRRWHWDGEGNEISDLPLPALQGSQQLANAAVVLQTLELAKPVRPVTNESIRSGLTTVDLCGRFQMVSLEGRDLLLDVAHNPQSARALAHNLREMFSGRRTHAVFSIMGDKDIEGVLLPMKQVVDQWYISPLDMARAASEATIIKALDACAITSISRGFRGLPDALGAVKRNCVEDDLIIVFGSFFLVAQYLDMVHK